MMDWLNPTQDMLDCREAGRQDRQNEVDDLVAEIERLQTFLDCIRNLATNPTEDHQTRCTEIMAACNRALYHNVWPDKTEAK